MENNLENNKNYQKENKNTFNKKIIDIFNNLTEDLKRIFIYSDKKEDLSEEKEDLTEKIYIHYGTSKFDPKKFENIKNRDWILKPIWWFWSSPKDSKNNRERFSNFWEDSKINKKKSFEFKIDKNSKILTIDSLKVIKTLPKYKSDVEEAIDFEKLAKEYDAINFIENKETHYAMVGWDCNTLLVMNKNIIIPLNK